MLTIVIPTYQERETMATLLPRLAAVSAQLAEPVDILVVDDRSSDGTADVTERFLREHRLGSVLRRQGRRDLSQAIIDGIGQARGELVAVMDADLSHPPELLPMLVQAVRQGAEIAIASRYVRGARVAQWTVRRFVLSRIGNALARPLVPVADVTSGFFLARSQRLKDIAVSVHGYKILLEYLVRGCVHRVQEVPYVFVDRVEGISKLTRRVLLLYVVQLARLYWHRLRHPCPHRADAASRADAG